MTVKWVQDLYDGIKNWKAPEWLANLMHEIQTLFISLLQDIATENLKLIEQKITEVAGQDIPPEEKFKIVFDFSKSLVPNIKDSVLNAVINTLVVLLKKKGAIN